MGMRPWLRLAVLAAVVVLAWRYWPVSTEVATSHGVSSPPPVVATSAAPRESRFPDFLPPEAIETLETIERGGPFTYDRDGSVFENRERRLPERTRGYYREYTVETPGAPDRGARRIVAGGDPPEGFYYTDDHYASFRGFEAGA